MSTLIELHVIQRNVFHLLIFVYHTIIHVNVLLFLITIYMLYWYFVAIFSYYPLCRSMTKVISVLVANGMQKYRLYVDVVILTLQSPTVTVCPNCFNNQELCILYLCVSYDSHCKQRLFP
jgi:hypothetical protein